MYGYGTTDGIDTLTKDYNKHISTISDNILNTNQNSLSTLDIRYIAYFYTVFPLHLNIFNRLFSDSIDPKLSNLKPTINQLIHSHSLLSEPLISLHNYSQTLKIDFNSLSNLLPSESIIHPFIVPLKELLIEIISLFDLTTTTDVINFILFSIILNFNQVLQYIKTQISSKLDEHIKQIESNIKSIFNETKRELNIIQKEIQNINCLITTNLVSLQQNYNQLHKFDKYDKEYKIIKKNNPILFSEDIRRSLISIYKELSQCKRILLSYNSINRSLSQLKTKLSSFNNYIKSLISEIPNYDKNSQYLNKIDLHLITLNLVRDNFITELYKYRGDFSALQNLQRNIYFLNKIQEKLRNELDSDFSTNIKSLQVISIKETQIHTLVMTMQTQIDYIIPELQLIKSLLQYRDSLAIISTWSKKLPSFLKNKVYGFLKNSRPIVQTLRDAFKLMDDSISQINSILTKIQTKEFYRKFHPETLESGFRTQLSNLTTLLEDGTYYMKIIRYIIYNLLIIGYNSTTRVKEIKAKIDQISDLSSSLKQLKEIYSDILKFYYIHVKTTFFLNYYSILLGSPEFQNSLRRLNEMIYETGVFIYFITLCYAILYHINVILNNTENLKPKVIALDKFNNNFNSIKSLVSGIIEKLKVLKSNISKLESLMTRISTSDLRDIIKFKYQIKVIRKNIDWLVKTFHHSISYIENKVKRLEEKCKEITKEIQKNINYLSGIILIKEILSIPSYLVNNNYKNPITTVLSTIKNHLERIKLILELNIKFLNSKMRSICSNISILELIVKQIKSNIKETEIRVMEMECAIEGVTRNFIRCSLLSV